MEQKKISAILSRNLAIIVTLAFLASTLVVCYFNTGINRRNYEQIIATTLEDVKKDIDDTSDINMLSETYRIKAKVEVKLRARGNDLTVEEMNDYLRTIVDDDELSEMSIGNEDNIIIYSSKDEYIGFDMDASPGSKAFDELNHGTKEIVQPVRANAYDGEGEYAEFNKYAGVPLDKGGYLQVAISADQFQEQIDEKINYIAVNRHIGQSGYVLISNTKGEVVSNANQDESVNLSETGIDLSGSNNTEKSFVTEVNGNKSLCISKFVEGYNVVGVVPMAEVQSFRNRAALMNSIVEIIIFAVMFLFISRLIEKIVVSRLRNVNDSLREIIKGKLDTTVDEYSTKEFAYLSRDINMTVKTLKEYTEKEKERIRQELEFARNIQEGAMPKLSSLNTADDSFDIFATMNTAREVGGDFYDAYKLDEDRLAILIADVSGKGIPAAMFMMNCKSMLKNLVESGVALDDAFTRANDELVESNDAGMFVTVWMGIVDLKTGHVEYVNAGHNPPLAYNENSEFEYMKCKAGFVLTGMEGLKYRSQEFDLKPGDKLYLYTDGVTEANDPDGSMYGEDRLLEFLNRNRNESLKNILLGIKDDIDVFADGAEQFDDITMLGLVFNGKDQ